ncbi:ATP-binding protein [Phenylobacterium sp.]|uniref:ATP-binding response regulator n=1 Tax=Phenylobacterium sp. TaxID=1871053 RepID=UPI00120AB327|nr:ATP-binding protein [Phenylobacterium sp.]THD51552.1 MAG: response regulator [Phenylobacterium sp.]
MTAPAFDATDPVLIQRIRAEQVRLLYASAGISMFVTLAIGSALALLLIHLGTLAPWIGWIWIAVMVIHTTLRAGLRRAFFRADPLAADWKRWADRFMAGALVGALTWGIGSLWLLAPGRLDLQLLFAAVLIAVIYGTISAFGSYLPAFFVLFLPAFLPMVGWFLLQGDLLHNVIAGMFLAWIPTVGALARRYSRGLEEALRLRFVNAALVEDLTAQKAIAEQANLAKSRFLASASHDLRQPVHALGMFVGALRGHRLQARSLALIDQVDASVAALDGLFTSLLDISRLDAEAVQNQPADIAVQPLLDRVCRDVATEADAKDVALIVVPTRAAVHSDPLLLERVMRNLIGNAVRYTAAGAVLVGCRRRGDRLSLEVWDTGPGIASEQREAVFEEFFQVSNPDRDRSKGLGLGLAIVRRLIDILGHSLDMQSEPGKGTVFRVLAPRAMAAGAPVEVIEPSFTAPPGGLILAIDDEQAIRASMRELLSSWGHQVLAVSGGASAFNAVSGGARPDLIICDFRLRDGESGIEVIKALRDKLGGDVPAILLTGDTAPENLRMALASGYPLLHKPLAHARLRAAVGSLIRRPRTAEPAT